jgi:high-affinity iron transporter
MGTGALVATAFLAVGREGLETALFVWASVRASQDGTHQPLIGVLLGIGTAVVLGWLFYRGALRINLAKFFTWTGGMLVVVAAGVIAYGVHDLQEAGIIGGLRDTAFDISSAIPPDSWYGTLLKGVFNFQPDPTVVQSVVWLVYLVPTLTLFLVPVGFGRSAGGRGTEQKATDEKADSGGSGDPGSGGTGDGDSAVTDGGRMRDGARGVGGRAVGEAD